STAAIPASASSRASAARVSPSAFSTTRRISSAWSVGGATTADDTAGASALSISAISTAPNPSRARLPTIASARSTVWASAVVISWTVRPSRKWASRMNSAASRRPRARARSPGSGRLVMGSPGLGPPRDRGGQAGWSGAGGGLEAGPAVAVTARLARSVRGGDAVEFGADVGVVDDGPGDEERELPGVDVAVDPLGKEVTQAVVGGRVRHGVLQET